MTAGRGMEGPGWLSETPAGDGLKRTTIAVAAMIQHTLWGLVMGRSSGETGWTYGLHGPDPFGPGWRFTPDLSGGRAAVR